MRRALIIAVGLTLLAGLVVIVGRLGSGTDREPISSATSGANAKGDDARLPPPSDETRLQLAPVEIAAADPEPLRAATPEVAWADPVDDPVGILLYGALVDESGEKVAVELASVRLDGPAGAHRWERFEGGSFAFSGLGPGRWQLKVLATGFEEIEQVIELTFDEPLRRVDVTLARAVMLPVRLLTPTGGSLQDAVSGTHGSRRSGLHLSVVATRERLAGDLPPISHRAYSRYGIGSYSSRVESPWSSEDIPKGADGVLQVNGSLPVWVSLLSRHVVIESQQVPPGAEDVVFVLPVERVFDTLGSVRLRVVDDLTGEAVIGATVGLSTSQGGGRGSEVDENGEVVWRELLPGLLDLTVMAEGYGRVGRVIEVPAGRELDLGDVPLDPPTEVSGQVVDAEGKPRSVYFRVHPVEGFAEDFSLHSRRSYKSGDDGFFSVSSVGRELFALIVVSDDWVGAQLVDARGGDVEGVRLAVVAPTKLTLRSDWPEEVHHSVQVFDAAGIPLTAVSALSGGRSLKLSLAPGEYDAIVSGGSPTRVTLGTPALEVALRP